MTVEFTPSDVATYYRARLSDLNQRGSEWRGPCPVHNGKRDSFAVNATTGRAYCHSSCDQGWDLLGLEQVLTSTDFKSAKAEVFRIVGRVEEDKPKSRIVAEYPYTDAEGKLLFQVVRFEPKDFRQRRPDGKGGWIWNLTGVEPVPYRLPEVFGAEVVYIVEGERDVETLEKWGLVATCNPMGAGKWRPEFADYFEGKDVVILPDQDEPGQKHAIEGVAVSLLEKVASVRIVNVPAKDVTEWVRSSGRTAQDLRALVNLSLPIKNLETLRAMSPKTEEATAQTPKAAGLDSGALEAVSWPKPQPIASELPPVQLFSEELLPRSFRALVQDIANRMQVPPDYPATIAVLCLAGAVSRRARIQPKANDPSWVVVPNLWGGIVAPPGMLKSPVINLREFRLCSG